MIKQQPGGEFGGAWEAVAASARGRKSRGWGGEFAAYSTSELIQDASAADEPTRRRIEAEISRRQNKGRR
jgi:hypothetical protein